MAYGGGFSFMHFFLGIITFIIVLAVIVAVFRGMSGRGRGIRYTTY